MKKDPSKIIEEALRVLDLPPLVSFEDIKRRYYDLSKRQHPDINSKDSKMREINEAYAVLKHYIFNYRFSFSDEEIKKQFPEESHADRFRF